MFSLGLAVGVVIAVGMLLYFQIRAILNNRTGIEDWILEKACYRRRQDEEHFIYPYNLGKSKNIKQVLNLSCSPVGDGISWEVVEGCDQYTLTREQIAQKVEKRSRTKIGEVVRPATGSYLPLFSQGFKICLHSPCTDEPRIKLTPGDIVKITRWRKCWLFGEKVVEKDSDVRLKKEDIRGWFPRRCVVELANPPDALDSKKEN